MSCRSFSHNAAKLMDALLTKQEDDASKTAQSVDKSATAWPSEWLSIELPLSSAIARGHIKLTADLENCSLR